MILLALLLGAAGCRPDAGGYCTSAVLEHELAYGAASERLRINTSLGDVVSIEFPDGVRMKGEPALGNKAIFDYRAQKATPLRVLVWPRLPRGVAGVTASDLIGERSNLQIFLDSGATLLVDLRIGKAGRAVQRVVLRFPERERESAYVREQLAAQARRHQERFEEEKASLQATVVKEGRRRMAEALLERHHCEDLSERAMRDLLIVRVHRICRVGAEITIRFEVHNRRRDVFHLADVQLAVDDDEAADAKLEVLVTWAGPTLLPFNTKVEGLAMFAVEGEAARAYALTVIEDGGAKRVVTVDDLDF